MTYIPFNRPHLAGREIEYIARAHAKAQLSGDGDFTRQCSALLEQSTGSHKALLTHSCTAALEMAALLLDIAPGDEVIMPSFTFVSTANAFVLRGAVPVFVDVRQDTLNIDEHLIEAAITERTKAVCVVHYAGVGCEMDAILAICQQYGLALVEDAAQAISASYKGRALGSFGQLGALSFHETKNVISGEGGALLVNDPSMVEHAEIIREKGTNRSKFFRGQVDKYTWVDVGSSYLPSELIAAFLLAQLENVKEITRRRIAIWDRYYEWASGWERAGIVRRPIIPDDCAHNGHLFYLLLPNLQGRTHMLSRLQEAGIGAVFHYVPLHSSPAGLRFCRTPAPMPVTDSLGERLLRMPLWIGLEDHMDRILSAADDALAQVSPGSDG